MFNSKKIKTLERENKNLKRQLEEEINDLILILEQIQETNNTAMQWKHRQKRKSQVQFPHRPNPVLQKRLLDKQSCLIVTPKKQKVKPMEEL